MELGGKNSFLLVLGFTVLVLCPFVHGGCQEQLMKDKGAMACILGLTTYMSSMGEAAKNLSTADDVGKLLCSTKGKSAFSCIIGYVKNCPELMAGFGGIGNPIKTLEKIPGFDPQLFIEEGGLDAVCDLLVGPCSEVKKCFNVPHAHHGAGMVVKRAAHGAGMVVKRAAPAQTNYYILFQSLTSMMCGMMKDQMECMIQALDKCPASLVTRVESEFEKGLNMSMPGPYGVVSYKDTKHFIKNECPKLPIDFSNNACTKDVFVSQTFEVCNEIVAKKYSQKRSCEVHDLSKQCISEHVQPKCGKEMAMFLTRNTQFIFPGIPDNCESRGDDSGSDVKRASFGILLISTFFALLLMF